MKRCFQLYSIVIIIISVISSSLQWNIFWILFSSCCWSDTRRKGWKEEKRRNKMKEDEKRWKKMNFKSTNIYLCFFESLARKLRKKGENYYRFLTMTEYLNWTFKSILMVLNQHLLIFNKTFSSSFIIFSHVNCVHFYIQSVHHHY